MSSPELEEIKQEMLEGVGAAVDVTKELMRTLIADKDFWTLNAEAMRKSYEALILEGFTNDQAIQLAGRSMTTGGK